MKLASILSALILACLAAPANAAALEAYGGLPSIETAIVSPGGHAVAIVVTNGEQRSIVVKDLASGAITLRGFVGEHKVRNVQWAGDKHLVLVTSATGNNFNLMDGNREWFYGSVLDVAAKKLSPLMRNAGAADLNAIFGYPIVRAYRGEPAVYVLGVIFTGGRGGLSLFRYDLDAGVMRLVEQGTSETRDWIVDAEGRVLAQELYTVGSGAWSLRLRDGQGWREVATATATIDRPYVVGLGRESRSVIYASADKDRRWGWREVRADTPGEPQTLPLVDNQAAIRAAQDGRMIGHYALVGDEDRYTFFDPAEDRAWRGIVESYAGQRVELVSTSADRKKIAVLVETTTGGPAYALVDLVARRATWLGAQYLGVSAADISPSSPVRFKAADGLQLSGYLTLPAGRPTRNLPLVVFPHGGPASRDTPSFDWWAQAMASRGYAVLQVNFRGSEGLGLRHLEAGYGQWGRKMQTDLSDGVRYLA